MITEAVHTWSEDVMRTAIIVQGGCGPVPEPERPQRDTICEQAAEIGFRVLQNGGSAIEGCGAAIMFMEDSQVLNGGLGSYRQADGLIRRDASMVSSELRGGSVAQGPLRRN